MRKWLALGAAGVLALGVVACGDDDDDGGSGGGGGGGDLSGSIKIDGSSTVGPFAQAAAEEFQGENPNVKISVGTSGHRRRLREVLRRRDRHLRRLAADQGRRGGPDLQEERGHLQGDPGRQRRHRRRDQQGARDRLPDHRPAQEALEPGLEGQRTTTRSTRSSRTPRSALFGPGTDSGTFDFFTDEINGEEGVSRKEYQPSEDDNVLVQGVEGDEGGLGYFGFSYYEQNQDKLNLVGVDGGDGCVKPSTETIQDGSYKPLVAAAVHVPEREVARREPQVKAFMDYVLENQDDDRRGGADRADDRRAGDRRPRPPSRRRRPQPAVDDGSRQPQPQRATPRSGGGAPSRRRGRRSRALLLLAALLSVLTTTGIVISLLARDDRCSSTTCRHRRLPLRHGLVAGDQARRASACCRWSAARS